MHCSAAILFLEIDFVINVLVSFAVDCDANQSTLRRTI